MARRLIPDHAIDPGATNECHTCRRRRTRPTGATVSRGARRSLVDEDWESLVYSVREGRCVVMLGPDAVEYQMGGRSVPVLDALTAFLQRRLQDENPYIDTQFTQVSEVADAVIKTFRGDRTALLEWVGDFFDDRSFDHPTLDALARMPLGLVVNTSPGLPVETSFDGPKPTRSVAFYDRLGKAAPLTPNWDADSPLIYHLYGSLSKRDSLVLSDRDLLDVLVSVIREDPPLPSNLVSAFRDPDRTFLFLGFQLYHWQLRVLMHVLDSAATRTTRSFALEIPSDELDTGTRNFYRAGHGIDFFDLPVDEFVEQLASRVNTETVERDDLVAVPPDSPAVFICHADADKPVADELARRLRANGLNTWLDKDDIRGGDKWDTLIERTLEHDAGYVVVLQSRNLLERRQQRSYVNKEIVIALRVQDLYPPTRKFLIPTYIDDKANAVDELAHHQSIDLSSNDGFGELVKVIKRDIQRGQKQWH